MGSSTILPPPPDTACRLEVSNLREQELRRRLHTHPIPAPVDDARQQVANDRYDEIVTLSTAEWREKEYLRASHLVGLMVNGWTFDRIDLETQRRVNPGRAREVRKAELAETLKPQTRER